ncbi:MAG TPA: enoyl-CoA hydratase [Porticoccaceae bacterium]|nr:enoyl-CoA hydratase [Porticoccaceae bacterium]
MKYREIIYHTDDKVAVITLNRPDKLNAWTTRMADEIQDATVTAADDDSVNVIVITGAGRGFSAGADMSVLQDLGEGKSKAKDDQPKQTPQDVRPDFKQKYAYFPAIPKPIIAAINGPCAGISLVMTLFCDMRIAAASAKFTSAFVKRGLITEYGGAWLLPRIAGLASAMDVWLTGRIFDGTEAKELGVVNRVLPDEGFLEAVMDIARDMANTNSPRSMRVVKHQVWESLFQDLDSALDLAHEEMNASIKSDDFKEGVAHFLQKRAPRFTGK